MRELPVTDLIREMRARLRNWYTVCPAAWIVHPSRCPPRRGCLESKVARAPVTLRLRNGMTWRCRLNEFEGFLSAFVVRDYDIPEIDWSAVRSIVDVGANVGAATLWFALRAPRASIVAIEPAADVFATLEDNVARNHLGARVRPFRLAVGGQPGMVSIDPGRYSLAARTVADDGDGHRRVPMVSLAGLLERTGLESVDVLKLDCEGAEYEILLNSGGDVLDRVGVIVGEFHPAPGGDPAGLARHLSANGFAVTVEPGVDQGIFSAIRPV